MMDLAVEAGFTDFGSASGNAILTASGYNVFSGTVLGKADVDASAFSLAGLASLNVGMADVFGKLGIAKGNLDVHVDYPEYSIANEMLTRSKWDVYYAFGVKKQFGPVKILGEYEIFNMYASPETTYLSIGGSYKS